LRKRRYVAPFGAAKAVLVDASDTRVACTHCREIWETRDRSCGPETLLSKQPREGLHRRTSVLNNLSRPPESSVGFLTKHRSIVASASLASECSRRVFQHVLRIEVPSAAMEPLRDRGIAPSCAPGPGPPHATSLRRYCSGTRAPFVPSTRRLLLTKSACDGST